MARNGSGTFSLVAGNPVTSGTAISSSTHNSTMSDIATALTQSIASDGQTTPTANLPMGTFRHTNVGDASVRTDYAAAGQVQDGSFTWAGTAGGTANAITLTLSPSISAYAAGQSFTYKSGASANTGAMTVAVSGLTTKAIQKNGAALASGDHPAGRWFRITYDGTAFQLEQLSPASAEVTASLALKAALAGATFTGPVTIPTLTLTNALGTAYGGTGSTTPAAAFAALKQAATDSATGVVELADYIEGTGYTLSTSATVACTPASLSAIRSYGSNGYQRFPGGLLLQWARSSNLGDWGGGTITADITFPLAFPNAVLHVAPTLAVSGGNAPNGMAFWDIAGTSLSTARIKYVEFSSWVQTSNNYVQFFAIGY